MNVREKKEIETERAAVTEISMEEAETVTEMTEETETAEIPADADVIGKSFGRASALPLQKMQKLEIFWNL